MEMSGEYPTDELCTTGMLGLPDTTGHSVCNVNGKSLSEMSLEAEDMLPKLCRRGMPEPGTVLTPLIC